MTVRRPVLLVVDDEPSILRLLRDFGNRSGFDVVTCGGGAEAMEYLHAQTANIAMVDLRMPEIGGLDVLRAIREIDPQCQAVLMTGYASVDTAVEAIKLGAMDYLSKPLDFGRLGQLLAAVRDEIDRRRAVSLLADRGSDVAKRLEFCGMIGRGPLMQELFGLIRRLAPHVRTALITGETGTGKELVARALHETRAPARTPVRHRQLLRGRRDAVRERALRPRARRVHRRDRQQAGPVRSAPTAARCSSTRSASCRWPCRRSCCACSSTARCSGSARSRPSGSTSA